jgi:hypothetical protein
LQFLRVPIPTGKTWNRRVSRFEQWTINKVSKVTNIHDSDVGRFVWHINDVWFKFALFVGSANFVHNTTGNFAGPNCEWNNLPTLTPYYHRPSKRWWICSKSVMVNGHEHGHRAWRSAGVLTHFILGVNHHEFLNPFRVSHVSISWIILMSLCEISKNPATAPHFEGQGSQSVWFLIRL